MEQTTSMDQLQRFFAVADEDIDRLTKRDVLLARDALDDLQGQVDNLRLAVRELLEGEVTPMARYLAERALEGTLSTSAPAL